MGVLRLNGKAYGGGIDVIEVTQAQYNALPESKLSDDILYVISDSVNGADEYPPLIFSTEEREVGVWEDGKPLYQKTFELGTLASGQNIAKSLGLVNIDKIFLVVDGSWATNNGAQFPIPYVHHSTGNLIGVFFEMSASDVVAQFRIGSGMSGAVGDTILTVRYTKTTDVKGQGTWNTDGAYAHHYSTNEKVVGTWIDGKPLYEKTITHTTNNVGGQELIDISSLNINRAYDMSATTENSNGSVMLNYFASSSDMFNVYLTNNNTKLSITHFGSWTMAIPVTVTLRYTKTTD